MQTTKNYKNIHRGGGADAALLARNNFELHNKRKNSISRSPPQQNVNLMDFGKVEGVFHLAAQASVPISIKEMLISSSTNILSSLKVIDYCNENSIPLIYASSSAIYGNIGH